jgi:hypothetical protein
MLYNIDHYRSTNDEVGFSFKIDVDATRFAAHHGHPLRCGRLSQKAWSSVPPKFRKELAVCSPENSRIEGTPYRKAPQRG